MEVAVQVHVFVGRAPQVRKAIGIEAVDVQHSQVPGFHVVAPSRVPQRGDLNATAAEALNAMAGAAEDQQAAGIGLTVTCDVHRQVFALAALERVQHRFDRQSGPGRCLQKLSARLRIRAGERLRRSTHVRVGASQASARRTQ